MTAAEARAGTNLFFADPYHAPRIATLLADALHRIDKAQKQGMSILDNDVQPSDLWGQMVPSAAEVDHVHYNLTLLGYTCERDYHDGLMYFWTVAW